MRFDWRQLSPKEKDAVLRYFILHQNNDAPVTAERVCAAMQETHFLSCEMTAKGPSVFRFVSGAPGVRSGSAISDDTVEGIYKAALRSFGIEVVDRREPATQLRTRAAK